MLAKFLKSRRPALLPPVLPDERRVYAIGDVHGCLAELNELLAAIDADGEARGAARTTLIFIGDLVDRGPDSAGVIERVLQLIDDGRDVRVLAGNHEEIFAGALAGDAKLLRLFVRVGGHETALSYGIDALAYERADYDELLALLQDHVPERHRRFLEALEDSIVLGDYLFVHAGVRPGIPLTEQSRDDLRWIRAPFLEHDRFLGKLVVHGHTIAGEVERRPHRIGIDTGAYVTGRLTALGLEGGAGWTLETGGTR